MTRKAYKNSHGFKRKMAMEFPLKMYRYSKISTCMMAMVVKINKMVDDGFPRLPLIYNRFAKCFHYMDFRTGIGANVPSQRLFHASVNILTLFYNRTV